MFCNLFYLIIILCTHGCDCIRYTNYTLFRAIPVNQSHIDFFSRLEDVYDINFWRSPGLLYRAIDFVINPKDRSSFLREAENNGVYLTTIINDVQSAFDKQTVKSYIRRKMDTFDWNDYYRLKDIYNWLRDLSIKYPKKVTLEKIGRSFENRTILAVKIILKEDQAKRPKVIVEGGIHAREWIGPAFVTYFINQILHANSKKDKRLKEIADAYEWYFVPVLNVDGYEYTHTEDRMWRKNRNGEGVDLNRNFKYAFGTTGVSYMPSSNVYCGPSAFSEKESQAMARYVKSNHQNLRFYLSFHSYGQYIILPYANVKKHLENYDEVHDLCTKVAKGIASRYKTKYSVGTAYDTVGYTTSGGSMCWVKHKFKVPYVVTFELRDNGQDGFALAPDKILPTCLETMDGLLILLKRVSKLQGNGCNDIVCTNVVHVLLLILLLYYT